MTVAGEDIRIRVEPSRVDPRTAKFEVDRVVFPGGPFLFDDIERAAGSPLPERLLRLEDVRSVMITDRVVTVFAGWDTDWRTLAKPVAAAIREALGSGEPALDPDAAGRSKDPEADAKLAQKVQRALDQEVNPGIAAHEGKIDLVKIEDGVVFVQMQGGCQGCGAATLTLKQGVEVMLRTAAPELVRIVDVTDHDAGQNPYFTGAGPSPIA